MSRSRQGSPCVRRGGPPPARTVASSRIRSRGDPRSPDATRVRAFQPVRIRSPECEWKVDSDLTAAHLCVGKDCESAQPPAPEPPSPQRAEPCSLTVPLHRPDTSGVATPARVHVPDALGTNRYLRSTWHPERQLTTISIWSDNNVCLAATNLEAHELPLLISHCETALNDAASSFSPAPFDWTPSAPGRRLFADLSRHARLVTHKSTSALALWCRRKRPCG